MNKAPSAARAHERETSQPAHENVDDVQITQTNLIDT